MLQCTFRHLDGIGIKRELNLWQSGIISWDDLESSQNKQLLLFESALGKSFLYYSKKALEQEDSEYFAERLPKREYYRIALTFPKEVLFLDIETTGLSRYYDTITIVGWSVDNNYSVLIKGNDDREFRKAMLDAKAIVTFNGSLFDVPFLMQEFPDLNIPKCHIDLRFLAKSVDLSGGQKKIEKMLGLKRPKNISELQGEAAPLLWYRYRWGDTKALKQLISYNHADVEGMKTIFDQVIERLLIKRKVPLSARSVQHFAKNKSKIKWATSKSSYHKGIAIRPYSGKAGPIITLQDLGLSETWSHLQVVGIDLTGNEIRPSGWCHLNYNHAITKRLGSDDEIVDETLRTQPNLVSIDSPLSLPQGRTSVSDDDPNRDKYGIMRICERILKKRGVNVYPSLIPSMQALTARGIKLANRFRSMGIPVIESYPGAAQDIMNIPRKRASLDLLSKGLEQFGIEGDFTKLTISHDELDAITSAVVGLFFWSGKFEFLGNDDEEYLIIPELKNQSNGWTKRKVIGLSGPIAAGKTTAGTFLKSKGFSYARYSTVLANMLLEDGINPSRQELQKIGMKVNREKGQRWLYRELIKTLTKNSDIVIDGLRFAEDHAFLIEKFGPTFYHIHVTAPNNECLKRYIANGGNEDEFAEAIIHPVEANVKKLSFLSHSIINNTNRIENFRTETNKAASQINRKG